MHLKSSNEMSKSKRSEDESQGVNIEGHEVILLQTTNPFAKKNRSNSNLHENLANTIESPPKNEPIDPLKFWKKSVNNFSSVQQHPRLALNDLEKKKPIQIKKFDETKDPVSGL